MSADVRRLIAPQVNANDDFVRLLQWTVERGAAVSEGDVFCVVETSKAAVEVSAEFSGVFVPVAAIGAEVPIGGLLGLVGSSTEQIEAVLTQETTRLPRAGDATNVAATKRALELARIHGIDIAAVAEAGGVTGTVKESDVERYVSEAGARVAQRPVEESPATVPRALQSHLELVGGLSRHDISAIKSLQHSKDHLLLTSIDYEFDLRLIDAGLEQQRATGVTVWLQHVVLAALGRALPRFPSLMSVRFGSSIYRYKDVDVAFVVRDSDGRLFTPVVRNAGSLSVADVARSATAAAVRVRRGKIGAQELAGACFTVSQVSDQAVTRFVAVPQMFQSAILAVAGERRCLGEARVTMTLSYDHGLCDATYAADFLRGFGVEMNRVLE